MSYVFQLTRLVSVLCFPVNKPGECSNAIIDAEAAAEREVGTPISLNLVFNPRHLKMANGTQSIIGRLAGMLMNMFNIVTKHN